LLDVFPDSLSFIQYHHDDESALPWSDARWTFYGLHYTPTTIFDGADVMIGSLLDIELQYNLYRVNHFQPDRAAPTDVTLTIRGEPVSGQTYRAIVDVGIEPNGVPRTLRIYMVQVLDFWPTTKSYYRNGFKQAAPTVDVSLNPGEVQTLEATFTFDAESWANRENIKLIAWAQLPLDTAPAVVWQSATRQWPLVSYPDDWDGDGVADTADNCPRRYNPDQADSDGDGVGDVCDKCLNQPNPAQDDPDEDGIGSDCDNCPALHSLNQFDADGDGVGDPCDSCPEVPAPAGVDQFGRLLGSMDIDCDVDADDWALFAPCIGGAGVTIAPDGCTPENFARADLDGDGDVDLNDQAILARNFSGALPSPDMFVGYESCIGCHAEQADLWIHTIHRTAYATVADSPDILICLPCHTVGYGKRSGFVDMETTPHLAGVQCESCHGPGSNHNLDPIAYPLTVSYGTALCGECHQSCHGVCGENSHPQLEQWSRSKHAQALPDMRADEQAWDDCLRCHSTDYRLKPDGEKPGLYEAEYSIECIACHNPHGSPNKGQLRLPPSLICIDCHHMESESGYWDLPAQPQAQILHGQSGFYLDETPMEGPYSMHWWGIADECVVCHMHTEPHTPEHEADSGHLFTSNMRACMPCHSEEVARQLVDELHYEVSTRSSLIARHFDPFDPLYYDPTWLPPDEVIAWIISYYNNQLVIADRSFGSHNPAYIRALLAEAEAYLGIEPWPTLRAAGRDDLLWPFGVPMPRPKNAEESR